MSRQQYNPNADLGAFSEWHRDNLIDCFRWIDIDYFGYQIIHGDFIPYVAIERIRLTNCQTENGPDRKPLERHKELVYRSLSEGLDIPSYAMWHTDECHKFILERIDEESGRIELTGRTELMDFLDGLCENQFGSLGYRW